MGGVWAKSRRYPGLTTQNPRSTYALSDFPMPHDYPEWPSGAQVQAYFEDYIDHFDLRKHIRFNAQVLDASLNEDESQWTVVYAPTDAAGPQKTHTANFDYLIVCNGIFSQPSIPNYDGLDAWKDAGGEIYHTSEFTNIEAVKDRHILVIGYGKSSCDAAAATFKHSARTTMVVRNLIWKVPKKIAGIVNFKHLFLTRLGEGLFPYIRVKGFEKFFHGWGRPVRNAMLGAVEFIIERQLKLSKNKLHPNKPLESIARSTISLVTPGFYEAIDDGSLDIEHGCAVASLEPQKAILSNGKEMPADVIIAGTGWQQTVPFFNPGLLSKVTNAQGEFLLYRSMLPVGVPRLAFNGYNSSFFSQLSCETGAMWIAEHLRGAVPLPPDDAMLKDINWKLDWMRERTQGKHCSGTNIVPFSVHHIDELLNDIDLNVSAYERFKQWFRAVDPSVYASLHQELINRANSTAATL